MPHGLLEILTGLLLLLGVAFNKFEVFSEHLAEKVHDLNADTLEVYLSNATPDAAADSACPDLLARSRHDRLRNAAGLSGNVWLTTALFCQRTFWKVLMPYGP